MSKKNTTSSIDSTMNSNVTRRDFMKYTAGTVACISLGSLTYGCASNSATQIAGYPIDSTVKTTAERMISFPYTQTYFPPTPDLTHPPMSPNGGPGLAVNQLSYVSEYDILGYGAWTFGSPLPTVQRKDIMAPSYSIPATTKNKQLLNFFTITDIHITDKEAPNTFITLQQQDMTNSGQNTSIYSPIMPYTTHVLDAAIQTANALHRKKAFDFAISLGDTCNCTSYNELRWYIDVIDGKVITPSSGAHLGADTVDYQKPYKAAGLDPSIPWFQALGNHDHFMLGSFPVDADPSLGLRASFLSDTVWTVPAFLVPNMAPAAFPANFSMQNMKKTPKYYAGVIDGTSSLGNIIKAGATVQSPKIAADPDRRSLLRTEWIQEFFKTTTSPAGHGFNLVTSNPNFNLIPQNDRAGFACYSFLPKSNLPLKVIVLDNTQREDDGSNDIHGHGFLDPARWAWLQAELADGQAANQLMIIAAHIPIGVVKIGDETEWWLGDRTATTTNGWWIDPTAPTQNAVDLATLVATLQNTPNLLMWIAGHRHFNTVKAFVSPDKVNAPEKGFWQVETSSLHDFPQQFRTFEIYLNSDYTVSIVTVNVDPAVADGTPAAKSRKNAIAAQQIVQNNLTLNNPNASTMFGVIPVPSIDPTRNPDGTTDQTIQFSVLADVPYNASYNAELFKQLSSTMKARMQSLYPTL
jgi:metallophosphoesterase (TIGR03768 family)